MNDLEEEFNRKPYLIHYPDFDPDIGPMFQMGISQELMNRFA